MVHSLHSLLKEQTKVEHIALEKQVMILLRKLQSSNDYGLLLAKFYRYINKLEQEIDQLPIRNGVQDYDLRRRSGDLKSDMNAIGFVPVQSYSTVTIPNLDSVAKAYGALYVLEGATMGGPYIKSIVQKKLPDLPMNAFSFYSGYGAKNTEMWTTFVDNLNAANLDEAVVMEGARDTFATFHMAIR